VGVALRGLNLRVAEELADHRQRHAARNEQRREGVAQIVDADGGQIGLRPDIFPEPSDVVKRLAFGVCRAESTSGGIGLSPTSSCRSMSAPGRCGRR
jgi:hypothetical protein